MSNSDPFPHTPLTKKERLIAAEVKRQADLIVPMLLIMLWEDAK